MSDGTFFRRYDQPAIVVTAMAGERRAGCLVGFSTQCSIYPPRLLVCISAVNYTAFVAAEASSLGVHILGSTQREFAAFFGGTSGNEIDKLANLDWHAGVGGAPILDVCATWLEGLVLERVPFGDHMGYVLEILDLGDGPMSGTLRQSALAPIEPGHRPEEILDR